MKRPTIIGSPRGRRAAAVVAIALAGCGSGDGLDRRAISGSATLDGRPLDSGSILFDPDSDRVGTAVGTLIRGGRFALARAEGPVPGRYIARVYAASAVQAPPPPGVSGQVPRPMVELIPPAYNVRSTLRAEVTADGPNDFRFAIRSEAPPPAPAGDANAREGSSP